MVDIKRGTFFDIGHGVTLEPVYFDGSLEAVEYTHPDKEGKPCVGWVPLKPRNKLGWDLLNEEPLTLSPSLLCRRCGHHGFIRNGKWVPA